MAQTRFTVDVSVTESGRKRPEYSIDTDLKGEVSLVDFLQFMRQVIIVTADEVVREEQSRGFDKNPVVAVDGIVGKPVINVKPFGRLEFTARADMDQIILETYGAILYRSPVLTGQYKSSNFVFLNGQQVATDMSSLTSWLGTNPDFKDGDLVRFVNIEPYARKLERTGVTEQRTTTRSSTRTNKKSGVKTTKVLQPNGTYFLTARLIRAKYKRNSTIKFDFIPGTQLGLGAVFKNTRRGKPGRTYLYPSILISVQESGTL